MIKTFIKSIINFSGKNNLEFEPEEKRFAKQLIDVCIEEARTPKNLQTADFQTYKTSQNSSNYNKSRSFS